MAATHKMTRKTEEQSAHEFMKPFLNIKPIDPAFSLLVEYAIESTPDTVLPDNKYGHTSYLFLKKLSKLNVVRVSPAGILIGMDNSRQQNVIMYLDLSQGSERILISSTNAKQIKLDTLHYYVLDNPSFNSNIVHHMPEIDAIISCPSFVDMSLVRMLVMDVLDIYEESDSDEYDINISEHSDTEPFLSESPLEFDPMVDISKTKPTPVPVSAVSILERPINNEKPAIPSFESVNLLSDEDDGMVLEEEFIMNEPAKPNVVPAKPTIVPITLNFTNSSLSSTNKPVSSLNFAISSGPKPSNGEMIPSTQSMGSLISDSTVTQKPLPKPKPIVAFEPDNGKSPVVHVQVTDRPIVVPESVSNVFDNDQKGEEPVFVPSDVAFKLLMSQSLSQYAKVHFPVQPPVNVVNRRMKRKDYSKLTSVFPPITFSDSAAIRRPLPTYVDVAIPKNSVVTSSSSSKLLGARVQTLLSSTMTQNAFERELRYLNNMVIDDEGEWDGMESSEGQVRHILRIAYAYYFGHPTNDVRDRAMHHLLYDFKLVPKVTMRAVSFKRVMTDHIMASLDSESDSDESATFINATAMLGQYLASLFETTVLEQSDLSITAGIVGYSRLTHLSIYTLSLLIAITRSLAQPDQ